jgi:hypothetical protein
MKTSELTGYALGWAVSLITNPDWEHDDRLGNVQCIDEDSYAPQAIWSQGGPIIEREWIELSNGSNLSAAWGASKYNEQGEPSMGQGPTPLIAAMRCLVASELGDEVEIPKELENV